jgi:4-amino-4-deoxychorismate lyase
MYPVFETIKVFDKHPFNIELHIERMKNTAHKLWNKEIDFSFLEGHIKQTAKNGLQKCRVFYNDIDCQLTCNEYEKKKVHNLVSVFNDKIDYPYKYTDRSCFDIYKSRSDDQSDILIIKNGRITDSSYANIALWNGSEWHTPLYPLFYGIKRKLLLHQGLLLEKDIFIADLAQYEKVSLINSMLDLGETEIMTKNIE